MGRSRSRIPRQAGGQEAKWRRFSEWMSARGAVMAGGARESSREIFLVCLLTKYIYIVFVQYVINYYIYYIVYVISQTFTNDIYIYFIT